MRQILLGILLLIIGAMNNGCHRNYVDNTYLWPSIDHKFDSINLTLDDHFNNFSHPDTIQRQIRLLDSLSKAHSGMKRELMQARYWFWRSKFTSRYGDNDSALSYIQRAMALTDSLSYRYDWLTFKTQLYRCSDNIDGVNLYKHYDEVLKFAKKIGDKGMEAQVSIGLGNLFNTIHEDGKSMRYYLHAESLLRHTGNEKLLLKNRINIALLYDHQGLREKSDSIHLSLLNHPLLDGDTLTQNLIPRNLHASYRDKPEYLRMAYNQIKDNERFRYLRGLYSALLMEEYWKTGDYDSLLIQARLVDRDIPYIKDHGHKSFIWLYKSVAKEIENDLDSAFYYRVKYEDSKDSLYSVEQANEVIRLDALEEIRRTEATYAKQISRRNWVIAFVAVVLIAIGVVTVLLLNRRHMRQKMRSMANELELEKAKRKMAATAITIEEKDIMLDTLRSELSEMRKDGEIKEGSARRLEASIKTHLSGHEQEETFRDMFDTINPGFTRRLRDLCPDLADSYVRLACYTLMELDNKRIASLMNIRPESVRQARWRLRKRLNIPEETALEDFLRDLNNGR